MRSKHLARPPATPAAPPCLARETHIRRSLLRQPAPTVLVMIDKWLHEPAIRRTGLVAFLAVLVTLVLVAMVVGPAAVALLGATIVPPVLRAIRAHRHGERDKTREEG